MEELHHTCSVSKSQTSVHFVLRTAILQFPVMVILRMCAKWMTPKWPLNTTRLQVHCAPYVHVLLRSQILVPSSYGATAFEFVATLRPCILNSVTESQNSLFSCTTSHFQIAGHFVHRINPKMKLKHCKVKGTSYVLQVSPNPKFCFTVGPAVSEIRSCQKLQMHQITWEQPWTI